MELSQQGWRQSQIAEALGVSRPAVSQWLALVREQGSQALRAWPHTDSPPKLAEEQLNLLPDCLSHGAEAYGFRGQIWTCARIAQVIQWEFGLEYSKSHVSRLMQQLDWSPQKPIERASQRGEVRIANWRLDIWPQPKKSPPRAANLFLWMNGFYLLPAVARTYAPRGETPALRVFQTNDHLSMMSGITSSGKLYTLVQDEALTGRESVTFLKHLVRCISGRLLVIWDSSPIHRSKEVKAFLTEGGGEQVHLVALSLYAPELNPDEGVWDLLRSVKMRNLCCRDLNHLHGELYLAITRLRSKPYLLRACFEEAGLAL